MIGLIVPPRAEVCGVACDLADPFAEKAALMLILRERQAKTGSIVLRSFHLKPEKRGRNEKVE